MHWSVVWIGFLLIASSFGCRGPRSVLTIDGYTNQVVAWRQMLDTWNERTRFSAAPAPFPERSKTWAERIQAALSEYDTGPTCMDFCLRHWDDVANCYTMQRLALIRRNSVPPPCGSIDSDTWQSIQNNCQTLQSGLKCD